MPYSIFERSRTQISKPITPSTPSTSVHSQLLQKQLEQTLKMDNANMSLQQNKSQTRQYQMVQIQKSSQNVSFV